MIPLLFFHDLVILEKQVWGGATKDNAMDISGNPGGTNFDDWNTTIIFTLSHCHAERATPVKKLLLFYRRLCLRYLGARKKSERWSTNTVQHPFLKRVDMATTMIPCVESRLVEQSLYLAMLCAGEIGRLGANRSDACCSEAPRPLVVDVLDYTGKNLASPSPSALITLALLSCHTLSCFTVKRLLLISQGPICATIDIYSRISCHAA